MSGNLPANSVSANGAGDISDAQLNDYTQSAATVPILRAFVGLQNMTCNLLGITAPNDGGGGLFYWNVGTSYVDDGQNTIVPPAAQGQGAWLRIKTQGAVPVAQPYIVYGYFPGLMSSTQPLLVHAFALPVTFPTNFGFAPSGAASEFVALVNATNQTIIEISQCVAALDPTNPANWTEVGSITVLAGAYTGAFATTGGAPIKFAQGDRMQWSIDTSDPTLANTGVTLAGDRPSS